VGSIIESTALQNPRRMVIHGRREDRERSQLTGCHAHLSNPIDTRELVAIVAGLLRLTR